MSKAIVMAVALLCAARAQAFWTGDEKSGGALEQLGVAAGKAAAPDLKYPEALMKRADVRSAGGLPAFRYPTEEDLRYSETELQQAVAFFAEAAQYFARWEGKVYSAPPGIKSGHEVTEEDWKLVFPIEVQGGSAADGSFQMNRNNPTANKLAFIQEHLGRKRFFIGIMAHEERKEYEIRNPRQLVNLYRAMKPSSALPVKDDAVGKARAGANRPESSTHDDGGEGAGWGGGGWGWESSRHDDGGEGAGWR